MHKLVILAAVATLAASSLNCANSSEAANSLVAPSAISADAKKPGHGNGDTGTLALVMVADNDGNGVPSFGDTVTFDVQTTATTQPFVTVKCSQSGTVVYQQSNNMTVTRNFNLGPTGLWTGGAADCTATLENWDNYSKNGAITALASLSFQA
jgi:hypothetical protein